MMETLAMTVTGEFNFECAVLRILFSCLGNLEAYLLRQSSTTRWYSLVSLYPEVIGAEHSFLEAVFSGHLYLLKLKPDLGWVCHYGISLS